MAQHLVDTGLTRPQNLVALGGSAGGLLMGAVANLAPDLFAGILAQVPFVDPLTTILDPSLPLTVTEWDEWGNPLENKDVYFYMKSYSPYENVEAKDYPADPGDDVAQRHPGVLRRAGEMGCGAAAHARPMPIPVLLKTEMAAGHGGISGRYERWKEAAFQYAWLLATGRPRTRYGTPHPGSVSAMSLTDIPLTTLDGKSTSLADYSDRAVLRRQRRLQVRSDTAVQRAGAAGARTTATAG